MQTNKQSIDDIGQHSNKRTDARWKEAAHIDKETKQQQIDKTNNYCNIPMITL